MSLAVTLATPSDDPAIRALLRRQPMPGRIRLTYEREPEFQTGCRVTGDDCQVLVARSLEQEVVGLACRSVRRVFVNGHEQRIGYLGQLRVDSRFRGKWLVSRGFCELKRLHDADPVSGYLTAIVDGNDEATGVLVRKPRRNFPLFHPVADYRTLAINVKRTRPPRRGDIEITSASTDDLSAIATFLQSTGRRRQFAPVWTTEDLRALSSLGLPAADLRIARRRGEMVGVAGLWDQSSYKQTVINGYTGWLRALAPVYNLGAPWLGRAALPRPGEKLRSAYIALLSLSAEDGSVFRAFMRELHNLAAERQLSHLLVGFDARDPLLPLASEYSHVMYPSKLYLAEWPGGDRFYEQLDSRAAYVEIATL